MKDYYDTMALQMGEYEAGQVATDDARKLRAALEEADRKNESLAAKCQQYRREAAEWENKARMFASAYWRLRIHGRSKNSF